MKLIKTIGPFLGLLGFSFSLEGHLPKALVYNEGERLLYTEERSSDNDNITRTLWDLMDYKSSLRDNGLTDKIQWDNSTLYIEGQPVFIYSGEFHYWRIPVPALYLDIFQKLKATGYNAVSIYFHWGFHNPRQGVFDFETGAHNLQPIFEAAKQAGLWIIARPGPYIHAETSAGGLPGWLVQLPGIEVRTNETQYSKHWKSYIRKIAPIIAEHQIGGTGSGTVILAQVENEYYWGGRFKYEGAGQYMKMITKEYRDAGIKVPLFHNDVGMARAWLPESNPGVLDLYGLDSYPRGFECDDPLGNFHIRTNYYDYFKRFYPDGPQFTPEFQGGAFDPWGGPGYEKCADMVGTSFVSVYYKNNIAQKFTLMNFYMAFGGTNWGYLLTPVVYSSYDYGAGIAETRVLRDKINEGKLIALFLRSCNDILHAELVGNSTSPSRGRAYSDNEDIYVTELRNFETGSAYYIVRHKDTNSFDPQIYNLMIEHSGGIHHINNLTLPARESIIALADVAVGDIRISTAFMELVVVSTFQGITVAVFSALKLNQSVQFGLRFGKHVTNPHISQHNAEKLDEKLENGILFVSVTLNQKTSTKIEINGDTVLIIGDKQWARRVWAPSLLPGPRTLSTSEHIIVQGPYLVRNAVFSGSDLHLSGDINKDEYLEVIVPESVDQIYWNGVTIELETFRDIPLIRSGFLQGPEKQLVRLPNLNDTRATTWKMLDSLPEADILYDDTAWVQARNSSTNDFFPPITLPCLYSGEYGFHNGIVIFRARFHTIQPAGKVSGIHLEVWGGTAFGYSMWLNGKFFASKPGDSWSERFQSDFEFDDKLLSEEQNILVIVVDNNGYDRDNGVTFFDGHTTKKPRGIKAAILTGAKNLRFDDWRLQGNAGGEHYDDLIRQPYNEDGLYAERIGAHFNGFNDTQWKEASPMDGFAGPGIRFYRTEVEISYPSDYDVSLAFHFEIPDHIKTRVLLFVNGYQMGRYVNHIGPQSVFPVYPGIINRGNNVIALAVWGMEGPTDDSIFRFTKLYLEAVDVFKTSLQIVDSEGLIPYVPKGREHYRASRLSLASKKLIVNQVGVWRQEP